MIVPAASQATLGPLTRRLRTLAACVFVKKVKVKRWVPNANATPVGRPSTASSLVRAVRRQLVQGMGPATTQLKETALVHVTKGTAVGLAHYAAPVMQQVVSSVVDMVYAANSGHVPVREQNRTGTGQFLVVLNAMATGMAKSVTNIAQKACRGKGSIKIVPGMDSAVQRQVRVSVDLTVRPVSGLTEVAKRSPQPTARLRGGATLARTAKTAIMDISV